MFATASNQMDRSLALTRHSVDACIEAARLCEMCRDTRAAGRYHRDLTRRLIRRIHEGHPSHP